MCDRYGLEDVRVEPAEQPEPATGNVQPVSSTAESTLRLLSVVQYFGPKVCGSGRASATGAGAARAVAIRGAKIITLESILASDLEEEKGNMNWGEVMAWSSPEFI